MQNRSILFQWWCDFSSSVYGAMGDWRSQFAERGPNELKTGHFSRRGLWLPCHVHNCTMCTMHNAIEQQADTTCAISSQADLIQNYYV